MAVKKRKVKKTLPIKIDTIEGFILAFGGPQTPAERVRLEKAASEFMFGGVVRVDPET